MVRLEVVSRGNLEELKSRRAFQEMAVKAAATPRCNINNSTMLRVFASSGDRNHVLGSKGPRILQMTIYTESWDQSSELVCRLLEVS